MSDEQENKKSWGGMWTEIDYFLELYDLEDTAYGDTMTGDYSIDMASVHRIEADRALKNAAMCAQIEQARELRRIADALTAMLARG